MRTRVKLPAKPDVPDSKNQGLFGGRMQKCLLISAWLLLTAVTPVLASDNGIKVHGNWTVTVSDPDGSIAQEYVFENALTGPGILIGAMVGTQFLGTLETVSYLEEYEPGVPAWDIQVLASGVAATDSCTNRLSRDVSNLDTNQFVRAQVSELTGNSFALGRSLSLATACVTGGSYSITAVKSGYLMNTSLNGSTYPGRNTFTEKVLDSPITGILPDQVVTLKVTISFE